MDDDRTKFEMQRLQLAMSIQTVAEAMRNCAALAENFANLVQQSNYNAGSSTSAAIQDGASEHNGQALPVKGRKRKLGTAEEDVEPTKRTRKPKDPNAPKRPASSYILFQNEIRKELRAKHPNVTNSELLAMISKQWNDMTDEDKLVYNNAVASAKEQFLRDKQAYDSRSTEEIEAANAATAAAVALKKSTPRARAPKAAVAVAVAPTPEARATESSQPSETSDDSSGEEEDEEKVKQDLDSDSEDSSEEEEEVVQPVTKKHKVQPAAPASKEKKKRGGK